jgi:hypothetical protein
MMILQGGIFRTVRLKESVVLKVSMKKLLLYALILAPVNLHLMMMKKGTIVCNL